jgi:wyosine [tRNA(Phe)-imidazoG37] synthetase (radical SAM superfamily)
VPSGLNIPARPGQRRRRGQPRANELKSKKKIIAKDVSEIYHVGSEVMVQVRKSRVVLSKRSSSETERLPPPWTTAAKLASAIDFSNLV